jgi:hypothetical protein
LADFTRTVRGIAFWKKAAGGMEHRPCLKGFGVIRASDFEKTFVNFNLTFNARR